MDLTETELADRAGYDPSDLRFVPHDEMPLGVMARLSKPHTRQSSRRHDQPTPTRPPKLGPTQSASARTSAESRLGLRAGHIRIVSRADHIETNTA